MSWGLGWKRQSEIFHLTLIYGAEETADDHRISSSSASSLSLSSLYSSSMQDLELGFRIELEWSAGDDEEQVALRLQSQLAVSLPMPQDWVVLEMMVDEDEKDVQINMPVVKRREPLRTITMSKTIGSGQQSDGIGVLSRLIRSSLLPSNAGLVDDTSTCFREHWTGVTVVSLCNCCLSVLPLEIISGLPLLEKLYLDNNRLSLLPPEIGDLKTLKVLRVDNNMLVSVPVELGQCTGLVELSLELNKLVRPLLDFRAMVELRVLRLFGNPLEFLPEILPLRKLRHLSLANIRIVADENLRSVCVQIEIENSSYFVASKHKLSAFFSLVFRFSSCHHPLLASALAKMMQDQGNCVAVGKDENALRQLISMISSDNRHVVEQACSALSSLAADVSVAMALLKSDIMLPIETVLKSVEPEELVSVLQVLVSLAFASDLVAQKMLTKDVLRSLKLLCGHKNTEVQKLGLLAVGNLAFCPENRRILVTSESLRDLLLHLTVAPEPRVYKAAARALAILGENEILRRAIRGRQIGKKGLRILSMDGGGMKGLATVQILKEIEKGTGKRIHEMFDLICGTSTGGMLAVALGIRKMTLDQCEEIYKKLGKLVFAEAFSKDTEAATWREKLDQLYKSSSQSFRVFIHGSKHSADQFERLLKEICADEDGDLLIESAVRNIPKVFVVSTLVSLMPAQPFLFRNYQYPAGTPEVHLPGTANSTVSGLGADTISAQVNYRQSAFIGSCKHHVWQAIRASSAAPYYLDDFSDEANRWQDGAIVANNPTIFAIREAQLLWPDTKIDCLVSIGCGAVPAKARRGGWRYLDTGQVLIESACSVDRVEEALSALLPMIPELHYFRFNPDDERCDMELDETDPAGWMKLETATEDYIRNNSQSIKSACERLVFPYHHDEKWLDNMKSQNSFKPSTSDITSLCLGWRRSVLLVEASHSPNSGRTDHHARSFETFCVQNGIRLFLINTQTDSFREKAAATFPTPFTSSLFNGSFPSSLLDGNNVSSIPTSPSGPRHLSLPVRTLLEKIQNLPQVGIIHLDLQNDSQGSILSWQNDVFVVAEPGELADKFVQSVKFNLLSVSRGRRCKDASNITNIQTIAELVEYQPYFQIGGIVHRYIGRQTQVFEDREIGAYMFRRTVPSMHLTPDDVRWMIGAWRERIIVCTGMYGPTPTLIKSLLDSGAKAVISPSTQPPELQETGIFRGLGDSSVLENSKFEIGEDEPEDEETEGSSSSSPLSDWADSDHEKCGQSHSMEFWVEKEDELSNFLCQFYDALFREGVTIQDALRQGLAANRRLRYLCHLPTKS